LVTLKKSLMKKKPKIQTDVFDCDRHCVLANPRETIDMIANIA